MTADHRNLRQRIRYRGGVVFDHHFPQERRSTDSIQRGYPKDSSLDLQPFTGRASVQFFHHDRDQRVDRVGNDQNEHPAEIRVRLDGLRQLRDDACVDTQQILPGHARLSGHARGYQDQVRVDQAVPYAIGRAARVVRHADWRVHVRQIRGEALKHVLVDVVKRQVDVCVLQVPQVHVQLCFQQKRQRLTDAARGAKDRNFCQTSSQRVWHCTNSYRWMYYVYRLYTVANLSATAHEQIRSKSGATHKQFTRNPQAIHRLLRPNFRQIIPNILSIVYLYTHRVPEKRFYSNLDNIHDTTTADVTGRGEMTCKQPKHASSCMMAMTLAKNT